MEYFNAVFLSRLQFAFVVSFHIIFPAITIGMSCWLAFLECAWLKTKHPLYKEMYHHWVKIFAVAFGMGVVSGIVMSYQFGTNWSVFARYSANVIGPLLALEVLTAFFLEASFLGIMLFGWGRVSPRLHCLSTILVAFGTFLSAFWILSVNSWMNTPAGYVIGEKGLFFPKSWLEIIFNPSFLHRFFHMLLAAYSSTTLLIGGVSAWYLLKKRHLEHAKVGFSVAAVALLILSIAQILAGHSHGANTVKYQPAKIAAIEGIWESGTGVAMNLIGWPNPKTETTDYAIEIPKAASWILTGDVNGKVQGLKDWPKEDRPPVRVVFVSFRIMVGIGVLMALTGIIAVILLLKKKLFCCSMFQRWFVFMSPMGLVALLAGWITTEVGRQPWVVYGLMRTKQAVSPIGVGQVTLSLLVFVVVYTIIFSFGVLYIFKLINKGPTVGDWHQNYGDRGLNKIPTLSDFLPNILRK